MIACTRLFSFETGLGADVIAAVMRAERRVGQEHQKTTSRSPGLVAPSLARCWRRQS